MKNEIKIENQKIMEIMHVLFMIVEVRIFVKTESTEEAIWEGTGMTKTDENCGMIGMSRERAVELLRGRDG